MRFQIFLKLEINTFHLHFAFVLKNQLYKNQVSDPLSKCMSHMYVKIFFLIYMTLFYHSVNILCLSMVFHTHLVFCLQELMVQKMKRKENSALHFEVDAVLSLDSQHRHGRH